MATNLSNINGNLKLNIDITATQTNDLDNTVDAFSFAVTQAMAFGTGNSQNNQMVHKQYSLTGTGITNVQLDGLTNAMGHVCAFTKIKALIIKNATTTTSLLCVGDNSGTFVGFGGLFTDAVYVRSGDIFVITNNIAGESLTAGQTLSIARISGATTCLVDIIIIGVE